METSPVQIDTCLSDYHMHDMMYMLPENSPNPALANVASGIFSLTKCTKRIDDENKLLMSQLNELVRCVSSRDRSVGAVLRVYAILETGMYV